MDVVVDQHRYTPAISGGIDIHFIPQPEFFRQDSILTVHSCIAQQNNIGTVVNNCAYFYILIFYRSDI
jgi:hypothetical protein